MDLGELQVFLTVAREGSFSRAAERLYRTQPAVSLAIRKLEESLGQPLFVRGSRPVRLTDAGNLLRDYAERVINLFARHRTALNMPIEMPTIESIKRFVQMGMGVAIVPRMCVQWEIEHGWMKEVKVRQLNMPRHVYLVSRRGARLPHAAAEFFRMLRAGQA